MITPSIPDLNYAQQKSYVTYTVPCNGLVSSQITLLEARSLLASSGTTGLRTWEAALHLGAWLSSQCQGEIVAGKTIIELGAGTGFLSLLCAKHLNAKYVLATDGDEGVIDDLQSNISLNCRGIGRNIDTRVLKWGHVLAYEAPDGGGGVGDYDLILGADLVSFVCL